MLKKIINATVLCLFLSAVPNILQARYHTRRVEHIRTHAQVPLAQRMGVTVQPNALAPYQAPALAQNTKKEECSDCKTRQRAVEILNKKLKAKNSTNWFGYFLTLVTGFLGGMAHQRFTPAIPAGIQFISAIPIKF